MARSSTATRCTSRCGSWRDASLVRAGVAVHGPRAAPGKAFVSEREAGRRVSAVSGRRHRVRAAQSAPPDGGSFSPPRRAARSLTSSPPISACSTASSRAMPDTTRRGRQGRSIRGLLGDSEFDYVGDSMPDVPVFKAAEVHQYAPPALWRTRSEDAATSRPFSRRRRGTAAPDPARNPPIASVLDG